jgi:hypothetical protein
LHVRHEFDTPFGAKGDHDTHYFTEHIRPIEVIIARDNHFGPREANQHIRLRPTKVGQIAEASDCCTFSAYDWMIQGNLAMDRHRGLKTELAIR